MMKKALLIIFSLSMVFIVSGFVIVAACGFKPISSIRFNQTEVNKKLLDQPVYAQKEVNAADYKKISLKLLNANLEVIPYDGDTVKLEYESNYEDEWNYSTNDSTVSLVNNSYSTAEYDFKDILNFFDSLKSGKLDINLNFNYDYFNNNQIFDQVKLYVPNDDKRDIDISAVNGSINFDGVTAHDINIQNINCGLTMSNITNAGAITLTDVNSKIKLENLTSPKLLFKSLTNGDAEIVKPQINDIEAKSVMNGNLTLSEVDNPYDYHVTQNSVLNGGVYVNGSKYNVTQSNGSKYTIVFGGMNAKLNINF